MRAATMTYDVPTSGVRFSFLVMDEELSLPCGGGFDSVGTTETGEGQFPQTPANLRRLANMLNAMADLHERTRSDEV